MMYLNSHSIEEIKKDTIKELIEEIDQNFERQEYETIWKNEDGTEIELDVGYAWEWWINYKKQLKKKYLEENNDEILYWEEWEGKKWNG